MKLTPRAAPKNTRVWATLTCLPDSAPCADDEKDGLGIGALVGIAVGSTAGAAVLGIGAYKLVPKLLSSDKTGPLEGQPFL
jgi:hypothetical protein